MTDFEGLVESDAAWKKCHNDDKKIVSIQLESTKLTNLKGIFLHNYTLPS